MYWGVLISRKISTGEYFFRGARFYGDTGTPRAGFEPAQNLISGLVKWSCAAVITTTPRRRDKSYGVMFLKFVDIDWLFVCNFYPCVLFESLSHVINKESHVYSWNLGKIYLIRFSKFWNLPCFTREISKFQKSKFGKFFPNFPFKHVITSTNHTIDWNSCTLNGVIL